MSLNQPLLLSSALVHQMLLNSDLSIQTSDCCQLIRYGFLNERIIANALNDHNFGPLARILSLQAFSHANSRLGVRVGSRAASVAFDLL